MFYGTPQKYSLRCPESKKRDFRSAKPLEFCIKRFCTKGFEFLPRGRTFKGFVGLKTRFLDFVHLGEHFFWRGGRKTPIVFRVYLVSKVKVWTSVTGPVQVHEVQVHLLFT